MTSNEFDTILNILAGLYSRNLELLINQSCKQIAPNVASTVDLIVVPGARIDRLVTVTISHISSNNLGYLHHHVSATFTEVPNLVDVMTDHYERAKVERQRLHPKVVLCHLVGMHLDTYNKGQTDYTCQQKVIDEGIPVTLNQTLTIMNSESEVVSPWIQETIHALTKGRRYNKYSSSTMGIPDYQTRLAWAKLFAKAARTNSSLQGAPPE